MVFEFVNRQTSNSSCRLICKCTLSEVMYDGTKSPGVCGACPRVPLQLQFDHKFNPTKLGLPAHCFRGAHCTGQACHLPWQPTWVQLGMRAAHGQFSSSGACLVTIRMKSIHNTSRTDVGTHGLGLTLIFFRWKEDSKFPWWT